MNAEKRSLALSFSLLLSKYTIEHCTRCGFLL